MNLSKHPSLVRVLSQHALNNILKKKKGKILFASTLVFIRHHLSKDESSLDFADEISLPVQFPWPKSLGFSRSPSGEFDEWWNGQAKIFIPFLCAFSVMGLSVKAVKFDPCLAVLLDEMKNNDQETTFL